MTTQVAENVAAAAPSPQDALRNATRAVRDAERKLATVRKDESADIATLLAAANEVTAAQAAEKKATNAVERADFEARAGERDAVIGTVRDSLKALDAQLKAANMLGINSFTVHFAEDGAVMVDANVKGAPRAATGTGGGGTRGTVKWTKEGQEYTSRQLIESFGDNQYPGLTFKAKDKDGAEHEGLSWSAAVFMRAAAGAGFDAPVKKLARDISATGKYPDGRIVE